MLEIPFVVRSMASTMAKNLPHERRPLSSRGQRHPPVDPMSIYTELRDRICTAVYPPGTVLNETSVGREFGVSRTPIRQVFQKLNYEGMLDIRNGVGTIVTEADTKTFEDIYRLRMKLSELIGEFSVVGSTERHIAAFEELLQNARSLNSRPDHMAIGCINLGVMNAILGLIASEPLREITSLLYFRTARIWHMTIPHLDCSEELRYVIAELEEILRALHMDDLVAIGLIRRNFIAMALARLKRYMQRSPISEAPNTARGVASLPHSYIAT
jgi:DNA-binding GntR family transcriptional regulator